MKCGRILAKKSWKMIHSSPNIVSISTSIESIGLSIFCKLTIPKIEIFSFCKTISDFFEECISLTHRQIIISLGMRKLLMGTSENMIHIISTHIRWKIEQIHIKWRDMYRSPWKRLHILWLRNLGSLDYEKLSNIISYQTIILRKIWFYKKSLKLTSWLEWWFSIEWTGSREHMNRIKNMSLSRTIRSHNIGSKPERNMERINTTKWCNGKRGKHMVENMEKRIEVKIKSPNLGLFMWRIILKRFL